MNSDHLERDARFMRRALALAERGWGQTAPNPMVGAVVVSGDEVVGEGWHREFGGAHAEVEALRAAGERARGATLYVTLEPCAHHGKTPPCVDAVLAAGVSRVVLATRDPTPRAGGGAEALRSRGVTVDVGPERDAATELNASFFFSAGATRPWVILKLAVSLDGAIAGGEGSPRWLTGDRARADVHRLRAGVDAIGVGAGTVVTDDPRLTVRHGHSSRVAPARIVFDRRRRTPPGANLVRTAREIRTIVITEPGRSATAAGLEAHGVEMIEATTTREALAALKERGIGSLLVEGGAAIGASLLDAALVDRLVIYTAPVILGEGSLPAFAGVTSGELRGRRLKVVERAELGDDVKTVYDLTG